MRLATICLCAIWMFLLAASWVAPAAHGVQRLQYNHPGLTVDLGVGLWAWPLPMDYDGDGDLDLVVSCPDKPYNGTYLFENPGPVGARMPVFKPARRVAAAMPNVSICYPAGRPRVLIPAAELPRAAQGDWTTRRKVHAKGILLRGRVRANQWKYADYDGDGALDLIVGHGYWGDYGWDDAYNTQGEWTRGPLRGYVYLIRNTGTTAEPKYEQPVKIQAGGRPVDVFGMPSPNLADFDGDGDLDLLCGEFLDGFTWFENQGTRTKPRYAAGRRLLDEDGQPVRMDLQMITPTAIDWDRDGDVDLICGDEDGRVALVEHTGATNRDGPVFRQPRYFQQQAKAVKFGALVTPVSFDWDGDGDEDLIAGNTAGYVGFIENLDGGDPPKWAAPIRLKADDRVIRIMAGPHGSIQGPAEAKWGYTTLDVADWDHDGLPDIVVNSIWGRVIWHRNIGTREAPKLAAARPLRVQWPGQPPKPKWNWWDPKPGELVTQWRTTPQVVDWTGDGLNDLVMLDHEGYLALFRRRNNEGRLELLPGERIFYGGSFDSRGRGKFSADQPLRLNRNSAGSSGRRKLDIVDWNRDGRLDLLVNSANVNLLLNISQKEGRVVFRDQGPLAEEPLAGHTTGPTTVDWNRDGARDLLIGAEDGHLYYLPRGRTATRDADFDAFQLRGSGFQAAELQNGGRAFSNRDYRWIDVPEELRGWRYTRTAGGERARITVTAQRDATLHIATAPSQAGIDLAGWQKVDDRRFRYTDKGRTPMQVYRREVRRGQSVDIPQGNWSGGLVLAAPPEEAKGKQPAGSQAGDQAAAPAAERPNVLFIAVDDLRAELGCYGSPVVKSPHIDRLAARGMLFRRAYCQQAVCNPSRASLLSGLRPSTLRIWDLPTHFRRRRADVVTLPQWFQRHGYFTQNIGKIFHNWRQDEYRGDARSWSVPAVMHYNTHGADKPQVKGALPPDRVQVPRCEMRDVPDEAYFDGRIATLAIEALGKLKERRQPFFLAVGFWKPHTPFNAPQKYWDLYDRSKLAPPKDPKPPRGVPKLALHDSREILRGFRKRPRGRPTADEAMALRHGYYAATSYVDAQVGKVIDQLDRLDLAKNTIIVFWSDHGFHLGEHGLWAKTSNFELDARVPLIIATPQHAGGRQTDALAELLDLYPTLTDLCGLPQPKHTEGESLRPLLENPQTDVKDAAFTWHPRPAYPPPGSAPQAMGFSMRTDRYRYTEWREFKTGRILARELYDHDNDPHETVNLAGRDKLNGTVTSLSKQLAKTHPPRNLHQGKRPQK